MIRTERASRKRTRQIDKIASRLIEDQGLPRITAIRKARRIYKRRKQGTPLESPHLNQEETEELKKVVDKVMGD